MTLTGYNSLHMDGSPENLAEQLLLLRKRVEALEEEVVALRGTRVQPDMPRIQATPPPPRPVSPPVPRPVLKERGNLESRLGSQVFNRIGVLALLIGSAWALKLAIDNQWIGPSGRILAGLIAGAGIVVWSERFRSKGFRAFSYSLKAVGTGVLYLSLWASFQLYHLLPEGVVFAAMLAVTAWNAWMAWAQDAELLAAYALAGGFATPGLLSTGQNHVIFLFSYLIVLSGSVVVLLAFKVWPRLLLGSLAMSSIYTIAWYARFFTPDQFGVVSFFTVVLFLLFAMVPLVRSLEDNSVLSVWLPLAASAYGSLTFYSLLQDSGRHAWLSWGAVALAALYLLLMRLQIRLRPNAVAEAIHLSLAIVFLTIAIPLKASGRWITIGWLAEGVSLYWIAAEKMKPQAGGLKSSVRWLSLGALALGYVGAITLPWWTRSSPTPFANAAFVAEICAIAALSVVIWIDLRRDQAQIPAIASVALNLLILVTVRREIFVSLPVRGTFDDAIALEFTFSAFMMLHGAGLLAIGFWKRTAFVRWQGLVLLVATIGKVFLFDMRSLSQGYRVHSFIGLGVLLMAVSFVYQKDWLGLKAASRSEE
ncbi:MAG: DUF2339 domain-containing protein [Acidobacteriaceae bacterium]|nr:DUF2339 domain-containing protein [Acidobacteriaceae bacterium]